MMRTFLLVVLFCLAVFDASAKELLKAELVKVSDGDTIQVLVENKLHKIRLLDIDCYESSKNARAKLQSRYYNKGLNDVIKEGRRAKYILRSLLLRNKNNLYLEFGKKDRFKRDLAYVYIGNNREIDVNDYMLKYGHCERYVSSYQMKKQIKR